MLSALSDAVSDEKVTRFAEILDAETQRLVWIAGELLNASYLEDPDCELDRGPCDVGALVRRVRRIVAMRAKDRQITVEGGQEGDLTDLEVDSQRLQSALHRLCDNALKYTEPGGHVTVSAARENGEVRIAVTDTGRGIPRDKIGLIVEKFAQLEEDTTREKSERGTGLGLYVVNRIATLHGGSLEVDSEVGEGSTFTIRIPVGSEHPSEDGQTEEEIVAAK
ncbi:MAG: hypothetical protein GF393_08965 [Armatimonadia bacterium]|nr:hypothetical protein [Armatimonadia bacterium]